MRSTCAIFQTPTPLTPPTSRATAVALGLTLSAAIISARFSGGTRLLQPRAAIPAVRSIPAFLAIFQTPAALTPPISLATAVALEGAFREAAKQYAGDHGERSVHLDGPARIGEG